MKTFTYKSKFKNIEYYKELLHYKNNNTIRRLSKFNLLAIYGALKCLEEVNYSKDLSIYVATKYGSVTDVLNVIKKKKSAIQATPFDFLNINSNNASFYIAKILNTIGKNQVIASYDGSLKNALKLAKFDMLIGETKDALVGLVDESLDEISNDNSEDISEWIYLKTLED